MAWNQRLKLLYLRDYLLENTDETHSVRASKIIKDLNSTYGLSIDRKTFYSDIGILEGYGIKIEYDKEKQGYRIINRDFDLNELQLLIDSVQSSKFITEEKAMEISNKLKKLASEYERKTLDRQNYVPNRIWNMNDSAFLGTEKIHTCINNKKKLSFKYFKYNLQKKREYNKRRYVVSPYALMWSDNNYYLIAYESKKIKPFRVDRMEDIKPLDQDRDGEDAFESYNLSDRAIKLFSMYGGREERVGLRFHNHLVGVVLDRFPKDVRMIPEGKNHFTIDVAVEVSPQFFGWLCGMGRAVKIISPDTVVKEMATYVSSISKMYKIDAKIKKSHKNM